MSHPADSHRSFVALFSCLMILFVCAPFLHGIGMEEELFISLCFLGLMGTVILVLRKRRGHRVMILTGLAATLTNGAVFFTENPAPDIATLMLDAVFYTFAIFYMARLIFRSERVTSHVITGAVCIYLLAAIQGGLLFALIDCFIPNSFIIPGDRPDKPLESLYENFIYYSFASLTTLGYGDIAATSTPARFFSVLEAAFGQIYLTVLVARLVGTHIMQRNFK